MNCSLPRVKRSTPKWWAKHWLEGATISKQARKRCQMWVDCGHCEKKIFVCPHAPSCIKVLPGDRDHMHSLPETLA